MYLVLATLSLLNAAIAGPMPHASLYRTVSIVCILGDDPDHSTSRFEFDMTLHPAGKASFSNTIFYYNGNQIPIDLRGQSNVDDTGSIERGETIIPVSKTGHRKRWKKMDTFRISAHIPGILKIETTENFVQDRIRAARVKLILNYNLEISDKRYLPYGGNAYCVP